MANFCDLGDILFCWLKHAPSLKPGASGLMPGHPEPELCKYYMSPFQTNRLLGLYFTKPSDEISPNLTKSRTREIWFYGGPIALIFQRLLGSNAAEAPVKFQGDHVNTQSRGIDS